jgi:hypothetical protein
VRCERGRETGDCGETTRPRGSKPARWFGDGVKTDLVVVQETLGDVLPLLETVDQFMVGPVQSRAREGGWSVERSMTTAGKRGSETKLT